MYLNGFCLFSNWMFSMNKINIIFTIDSKSLSTREEKKKNRNYGEKFVDLLSIGRR
jgi:hypothetical protein